LAWPLHLQARRGKIEKEPDKNGNMRNLQREIKINRRGQKERNSV